MMRFFFRIIHLLLLVSVPSCLMSVPKTQLCAPSSVDQEFSYDAILALIEKIESGELEEVCALEDLERINQMLARFARQGLLSNSQGEEEELEEDIEELLSIAPGYSFSSLRKSDYMVFPAVFYSHERDVVLCKSWLKKKCHQVGKFVRHHKKEILIGAAVVAAVVAVAIVTTAAVCTAAGAAAGAATSPFHKDEPKGHQEAEVIMAVVENTPHMQGAIEEHISSFKELVIEENYLQISKEEEGLSLGEKARDLGSYLAHELLDGSADLAIVVPDSVRAAGHEKIDQIFSTQLAVRWSPDVKANSVMDNFATGIIPIPGQVNGATFVTGKPIFGRIPITEVNPVKGWVVGQKINNLTQFGTVPTWSTVRRRYWKTQAHFHPNEYNPVQLERMKKGLAPQRINNAGELESMELHHIPPQREGNLFDVVEVWPDEHAFLDNFRQIRE